MAVISVKLIRLTQTRLRGDGFNHHNQYTKTIYYLYQNIFGARSSFPLQAKRMSLFIVSNGAN